MIDLEKIKERRAAIGDVGMEAGMEYWRFVSRAPADIAALVAEVERLQMLLARVRKDRDEWVVAGVGQIEERDKLQSCGHPRSAIVSNFGIGDGTDVTNYCGMCNEEAEAEVRRDDRMNTDPELHEPMEMREEEVRY